MRVRVLLLQPIYTREISMTNISQRTCTFWLSVRDNGEGHQCQSPAVAYCGSGSVRFCASHAAHLVEYTTSSAREKLGYKRYD